MRRFKSINSNDIALEMARYRVHKIRRFYTHLFIYVIGVLLYVAKTYFGAPFNFWPIRHINSLFIMIWTFIIAIQGIKLFFRENVFNSDWEQRKMQEYLNKDKQNKWE
ncbi:MAG TPA: 2TM domain-containing protein [Flavobacterium sp.]|uniref:2TM domain-containing protein n=1 Tax=Flavobacterium sp. TaxID=239 RepID=UPI002C6C3C31|nr:2TM domain-containing protein [Flavobacterium sp.]HNP32777.1 2TM domain-containing protein [Flavobacterium sp.]